MKSLTFELGLSLLWFYVKTKKSVLFTIHVEFMAFVARYAINDVIGGACEIMPDYKIRFRSTNDGVFF